MVLTVGMVYVGILFDVSMPLMMSIDYILLQSSSVEFSMST